MTRFVNVSAAGSDRTERVAVEECADGWITVGAGTSWGDGPVVVDGVPHDAIRRQDGLVVFRPGEARLEHWIYSVPADLLVAVSVLVGLLVGGSVVAWGDADYRIPALVLITYCGIYGGVYVGRYLEAESIRNDILPRLPPLTREYRNPRMVEFVVYAHRRLDRSATESDRHHQALNWIVWPVLASVAVLLVALVLKAVFG
jgi:hypothetical protein